MLVPIYSGSTEAIGTKYLVQGNTPQCRLKLKTLCLQGKCSNHYTMTPIHVHVVCIGKSFFIISTLEWVTAMFYSLTSGCETKSADDCLHPLNMLNTILYIHIQPRKHIADFEHHLWLCTSKTSNFASIVVSQCAWGKLFHKYLVPPICLHAFHT